MTNEEISAFVHYVITYTTNLTILTFKDGTKWNGYFGNNYVGSNMYHNNQWNFVPFGQQGTPQERLVDGNELTSIEIKTAAIAL